MIQVNIFSYKYGHLVSQAIESVLSQTKKVDKIVVFDDGVGDCDFVPSKYPVELVKREKNLGIVENFNQALFSTEADRVLMLGADNWLHPLAIERMSQANVDIASSDIVLFGEQVDEFRTGLPTTYKDGFYIWNVGGIHGSSLFNAELAKSVGGYKRNEKSIKSEEDKMLFDAMLNAGATHKHITEPLLFYRRHKHNFQ